MHCLALVVALHLTKVLQNKIDPPKNGYIDGKILDRGSRPLIGPRSAIQASPKAEVLLRDKSCVELTELAAQELIGDATNKANMGGIPVLLRAVGTVDGKFSLELYVRSSGDVWVGGGANSRCPVPMKRRAVVARLEKMPREVFVSFVVGK